jgi:hypothetical protein
VDPNRNTTTNSNVAFQINSNGTPVSDSSTTVSNTDVSGPMVQFTGMLNSNQDRYIYWVYQKQPLTIINNASAPIQVQTQATANQTIAPATIASLAFPVSTVATPTSSQVLNIPSGQSNQLVSTFTSQPYTNVIVWSGGSAQAGQPFNYALSFQGLNFNMFGDITSPSNPAVIQGVWDQATRTLTITDVPQPLPPTGRVTGQPCSLNTQCLSQFCDSSSQTCQPQSQQTDLPLGRRCDTNSQCQSNYCQPISNICSLLPTGQTCTAGAQCTSGVCTNGVCQAPTNGGGGGDGGGGGTTGGTTSSGLPWWGWLLIIVIVIVIIVLIIVIASKSGNKKSDNSVSITPAEIQK